MDKLLQVLSESFNLSTDQINLDSKIIEFEEWDSMSHIMFITQMEESFSVNLDGDEIASITTVQDVVGLLNKKGISVIVILRESSIVITGAGGNLGSALVEFFQAKVESVWAIDRDAKSLDKFDYPNVHPVICDLCSLIDIDRAFSENEGMSSSNVLVNNAGMIYNEPLINLLNREDIRHSTEAWHKTIDLNLNALFYVSRAYAGIRVKSRKPGLIVNISSISANGNIGQSAYSASKAAVEALTKTWSKELGMLKIRTNAVAPGFIDTKSTRANLSDAVIDRYKKSIPLKRLGTTDEYAKTIQFLIENDYLNGAIIPVDGGMVI